MHSEEQKPRQIVKSMKLANHLLEKGFRINEIRRNREKLQDVVYFFDNSAELQAEITEYLNELNKKYTKKTE